MYNECWEHSCALSRCYPEGKRYRKLIAKLASQKITNGFTLMGYAFMIFFSSN